jgi:hypothetical protein
MILLQHHGHPVLFRRGCIYSFKAISYEGLQPMVYIWRQQQ